MSKLTSRKPYLIRAINEWILDNNLTPFLSVDATMEDVNVPVEYVQEGEITLNIDPSSVRNLHIGEEFVLFDARFSGKPFSVEVPVSAVQAIYARENGEGMLFVADDGMHPDDDPDSPEPEDPPPGKPNLKIVK